MIDAEAIRWDPRDSAPVARSPERVVASLKLRSATCEWVGTAYWLARSWWQPWRCRWLLAEQPDDSLLLQSDHLPEGMRPVCDADGVVMATIAPQWVGSISEREAFAAAGSWLDGEFAWWEPGGREAARATHEAAGWQLQFADWTRGNPPFRLSLLAATLLNPEIGLPA